MVSTEEQMRAEKDDKQPAGVYIRIRPHAESGGHAKREQEGIHRLHDFTETSVIMANLQKGTKEHFTYPSKVVGPTADQ